MQKMVRFDYLVLLTIVFGLEFVCAQDGPSSCYGAGSIAASVIITSIVLCLLALIAYLIWKRYWKTKKGQHLVLETDPEKGQDEYAFDNPGFKDTTLTPATKATEKSKVDNAKAKWTQWSPLNVLTTKNEKRKTVDDSAIGEEAKIVALRSHDFTGLGFNVCGNMRNGIFIKDILHRGPASESGKLHPGDRIKSVTINFEHMVYEDALTILSYASPYEVIIEAKGGKMSTSTAAARSAQPCHPLYKSSSSTDLLQIGKSARKCLFQADERNDGSNNSSLQKTHSNATTLERSQSKSPKPSQQKPDRLKKLQYKSHLLNPDQLKTQLEQRILEDHKQNLKNKNEFQEVDHKTENEIQKSENRFQKFGIRVLPIEIKPGQLKEQKSPKSAELSQNDNNINLERHHDGIRISSDEKKLSIDEVDKNEVNVKSTESVTSEEPPHASPEPFVRQNSLNDSGIKRDKNGIPQEIPNHMFNAAVAARKNRKSMEVLENEDLDSIKSPKKAKGRAPAPPDEKNSSKNSIDDSIEPFDESQVENLKVEAEVTQTKQVKDELREYNSDSDMETDNQSSVNTIELNASDITIHQTEDTEEIQNRKTASTGDLTKIQKTRKTSTGTLERAQSLDITDTGMPTLSKKRKGAKLEDNYDSKASSDESLYGKVLINKEPRLSLVLDGLNTFQRSRLKKSTEWGNLEDAILNLNQEEGSRVDEKNNLNLEDKTEDDFDALVNKINEIKQETAQIEQKIEEKEKELHKNVELLDDIIEPTPLIDKVIDETDESYAREQKKIKNQIWPIVNDSSVIKITETNLTNLDNQTSTKPIIDDIAIENDDAQAVETIENDEKASADLKLVVDASIDFLNAEKNASSQDISDYPNKFYDINASDDIKVSRHSMGSLERPKSADMETGESLKIHNSPKYDNISNVVISDDSNTTITNVNGNIPFPDTKSSFIGSNVDETIIPENVNDDEKHSILSFEKVVVTTPDLIKNVTIAEAIHDVNNQVTIEGPTSLTFEIPGDFTDKSDLYFQTDNDSQISNKNFEFSNSSPTKPNNNSLTYITEIQVLTPNNTTKTNISEIEVAPKNSLDTEFEKYVKNFETNIKNFETNIKNFDSNIQNVASNTNHEITNAVSKSAELENVDPEKELHKIQEIAEEQLKKLPEMRFTTSSYESSKMPEKRSSQIEQLRSNFERNIEKSPPKTSKTEIVSKSRIPIATSKTPPTSPERRDSRNLDQDFDKAVVEIMSSGVHSVPLTSNIKYQPKSPSKNITVTSIRSNSKIPSGLANYSSRPPVPPRRSEILDSDSTVHISANGSTESSFKQWVFNPAENSITNITVTDNKNEQK